jgi:hypothetical protein
MDSKTTGYQNHGHQPNISPFRIDLGFPMTKSRETSLKLRVCGNSACSPYQLGLCLDFNGEISNPRYKMYSHLHVTKKNCHLHLKHSIRNIFLPIVFNKPHNLHRQPIIIVHDCLVEEFFQTLHMHHPHCRT